MKIECDVCQTVEASVFCCADEAALCVICDSKVHAANKLASKHPRLSLLHSEKDFPRCDICQEKRAFFFCREDRALLCRDCDFSVHSANDLTGKHTRFLVPGLKVSLHPLPVDASPSTLSSACSNIEEKEEGLKKNGNEMNKKLKTNPLTDLPVFSPVCSEAGAGTGNGDISQFLNEVEEFLTSSPEPLDWFAMENSHKAEDIGKALAADWAADLGLSLPAEAFYGDSLAEVPNTPSPLQGQTFTFSYSNIMTKPKQKPVFTNFNKGDDTFIVPSIISTKRMRPSWNI
ncbi:hypothetical protein SUGI_0483430 [Cryptomeria japonica]|uniref:B-box zinc finger protein 24 n=1 Tax=Cryptomeria japonica TaxID=3369 RepID=UPI002408EA64|nr:B-box zinc finger protein 24 [Cryptomeria japonica]GLJ25252.1 hypothetical protein SUGI_0483430 [Cryptomeria japonica]